MRGDVEVFAATLKETVPLPDPLAPPVIRIQLSLLTAVHPHPVAASTSTSPAPPADPMVCPGSEMVGAHDGEKENWLDAVLTPDPPGPSAVTLASNTTPGVGTVCRSGRKSTRMTLPAPGAGLPRFI